MRAVIIDFENRNLTIRTPFDDSRSECLFGKTFLRKRWSSFVRSQCVHSLIWACIILRLRRSESLFYSFRLYVMILFWVCFFRNDFLPFFHASTDISISSFFFSNKNHSLHFFKRFILTERKNDPLWTSYLDSANFNYPLPSFSSIYKISSANLQKACIALRSPKKLRPYEAYIKKYPRKTKIWSQK